MDKGHANNERGADTTSIMIRDTIQAFYAGFLVY